MAKNYLTFSSDSSFTIAMSNGTKSWTNKYGENAILQYSTDLSNWTTWDGTTTLSSINNVLYMRGRNVTSIGTDDGVHFFVITGSNITCKGNIENLLDYEEVSYGEHPEMGDYAFAYLFHGCTGLIEAPYLPSTALSTGCYEYMFSGCSSLTKIHELPTLNIQNDYVYMSMFRDCTALVKSPNLPATTISDYCYASMFRGCTNLETIPNLPATTIPEAAYNNMFNGCTKIKLSDTQTEDYNIPYRIPTSGTGSAYDASSLRNMFISTGGTFTGTPAINTTYYLYGTLPPRVVNKVVYNNTVLLDLTGDTITPADVREGVTFHTADGNEAIGTLVI